MNMKAFVSGMIGGFTIGIITGIFGVPFWVGFLCYLVGLLIGHFNGGRD